jgi:Tol biopolymer transport system component
VTGPLRDIGFSGDGSEIWLAGTQRPPRRMQLLPLIGGSPRNFLPEDVAEVAWSPDGRRLVYHSWNGGDAVFMADGNGMNVRLFLPAGRPDEHRHFLTWSQDGRWIIFARGRAATKEMDLWRMPAEGGEPERLTKLNTDIGFPTPVNERILLYIAHDNKGEGPWLWAFDLGTKRSERLFQGFEKYSALTGSSDGRKFAASVVNTKVSLWTLPILNAPATERDVRPYPLSNARALAPRFGGGTLFFLSSKDDADGLWSYRDGREVEVWKGSDGALQSPAAISPDGSTIAIALKREEKRLWYLLGADGTELRALSNEIDARGTGSWSPDGKWIVTSGRDSKGEGLFKIPVQGGSPVRIRSGPTLDPVWSPAGNLIVYSGANTFTTLPLEGVRPDGTPVDLPSITLRRDGERVRFLPDGSGLVFMPNATVTQDFWLLDLGTMKTRPLTHLENSASMRTFDVTPDGKQIVFDRAIENSDIVLIDLPARNK